jgi:hypothetical protein
VQRFLKFVDGSNLNGSLKRLGVRVRSEGFGPFFM